MCLLKMKNKSVIFLTIYSVLLTFYLLFTKTSKNERITNNQSLIFPANISHYDFPPPPPISFIEEMRSFPWTSYKTIVQKFETTQKDNPDIFTLHEIQRLSDILLYKLVHFLIKSPSVPMNQSCLTLNGNGPPLFEMPDMPASLREEFSKRLLCKSLNKPRKVGILLQFGFDVDSLEIHLNELNDFVDKFFLIESVKPHSQFFTQKPLMWDLIKLQERFLKFGEKVVHFVVDDADLVKREAEQGEESEIEKLFKREWLQEQLRWEKFLEWNSATKYFSKDDLVGFGDVDEIPSRHDVIFLKNCHFNASSVDIGIWFPFDGMNTVFKPDFPVLGHKYTLGDPTFWTLASAKKYYNKSENQYPTRMRGESPTFLLGGMHLSRYAYPPFQLTKLLTASEASVENLKQAIEVGILFGKNKTEEAEGKLNQLSGPMKRRVQSMEQLQKSRGFKEQNAIVKIPWFLQCNRDRYPGFWKEHDFRLDGN